MCLPFIFPLRAENTAFWLQNQKKTVNTLCFPPFREFGGSGMYRLRIRSGPSKIREKWKTQCVYCLFSRYELKTLRFGFRTGKKTVNTLCFPLFREFGGSGMYRLRIRSGPSKIREKWKTQCVYCLFSGSELKTHCVFHFFVNSEGPGCTG